MDTISLLCKSFTVFSTETTYPDQGRNLHAPLVGKNESQASCKRALLPQIKIYGKKSRVAFLAMRGFFMGVLAMLHIVHLGLMTGAQNCLCTNRTLSGASDRTELVRIIRPLCPPVLKPSLRNALHIQNGLV